MNTNHCHAVLIEIKLVYYRKWKLGILIMRIYSFHLYDYTLRLHMNIWHPYK